MIVFAVLLNTIPINVSLPPEKVFFCGYFTINQRKIYETKCRKKREIIVQVARGKLCLPYQEAIIDIIRFEDERRNV